MHHYALTSLWFSWKRQRFFFPHTETTLLSSINPSFPTPYSQSNQKPHKPYPCYSRRAPECYFRAWINLTKQMLSLWSLPATHLCSPEWKEPGLCAGQGLGSHSRLRITALYSRYEGYVRTGSTAGDSPLRHSVSCCGLIRPTCQRLAFKPALLRNSSRVFKNSKANERQKVSTERWMDKEIRDPCTRQNTP